jgi:hypothetical protein
MLWAEGSGHYMSFTSDRIISVNHSRFKRD